MIQDQLLAQLQQPGSQSKKFRMVTQGLIGVVFVFLVAIVAMIWKPGIASSISSLAMAVVPSIALLVGVYAGAQAAVDVKTTSALTQAGAGS